MSTHTILLIIPMLLLSWSCSKEKPRPQCNKDTDCKGQRICEKGNCVSPPERLTTGITPPSSKASPYSGLPMTPKVQIPSLPGPFGNLPKSPSMPQLDPGNLLKGLNLNLQLHLGSGKDQVTLKFKGLKNGAPAFEVCKQGKCEELSASNPASLQKILEMLTGPQGNDPLGRMFQDLLKNIKPGGGGHSLTLPPLRPGTPRGPGFSPKTPTNKRTDPYRDWASIQKDGTRARGAEAILGALLPVQVSAQSVVFKTARGYRVEVTVPDNLK
ncbi:hypothetical protein KKF84_14860, partial [Myxococcota bacterium]|nr:hypothetical protein [Myxococcota bacterium]